MDMTRRNFLFASLTAMAAATITPSAAFADEYETKIKLLGEKFDAVVYHGRDIFKENNVEFMNAKYTDEHFANEILRDEAFDDLFAFMKENFKAPTKENMVAISEATYKIFHEGKGHEWRDVPPTLVEEVIPIAVIRDLLCNRRIKMNPAKVTYFVWFAETYQEIILSV